MGMGASVKLLDSVPPSVITIPVRVPVAAFFVLAVSVNASTVRSYVPTSRVTEGVVDVVFSVLSVPSVLVFVKVRV